MMTDPSPDDTIQLNSADNDMVKEEKVDQFSTGDEPEQKCPDCDRVFFSERSLRCHVKIHNDKILECSKCSNKFNRVDILLSHITDHLIYSSTEFECHVKDCGKVMKTITEAEKHAYEEHLVNGGLKCKECNETSSNFRRLFSHYETKHGSMKEYCDEMTLKHKKHLKDKKNQKRKERKRLQNIENDQKKKLLKEDVAATSTQLECIEEQPAKEDTTSSLESILNQNTMEFVNALKSAVTKNDEESSSQMLEKISHFIGQFFPLGDDDSYYKCTHCKLGFGDAILWMTHLGFHDNEDPFKCSGCKKKFENRLAFVIHLTYFAHGSQSQSEEEEMDEESK